MPFSRTPGMQPFHYQGVYTFAPDGSGHTGTYCNADAVALGYNLESENVHPIFADSEHDYYPECEVCGGVFDYVKLTPEGAEMLEHPE